MWIPTSLGLAFGVIAANSVTGKIIGEIVKLGIGNRSWQQFDQQDMALNLFDGSPTFWGNVGYWQSTDRFPEANQNLARLLAKAVDLQPEDRVLDVGIGLGEQARFWIQQYQIKDYIGINPSPAQIAFAKRLLSPQVCESIRVSSQGAQDLLALTGNFDKIMALDCAYHFPSRQKFFSDAFNKMANSGHLGLTDMVLNDSAFPPSYLVKKSFSMNGVSASNLITISHYQQQLTDAGFQHINILDISDHVFGGFYHFLRSFVKRHHKKLTGAQLLRYKSAAAFAKHAHMTGRIRYIVASASKSGKPD